ncbi:phage tail sheath family protein [Citricoccus zhacaiensis]|uniref:phage tail sheath family protein n=2 Tax=Citricoccus TaxID=169133 RepID=UPI003CF6ECEE
MSLSLFYLNGGTDAYVVRLAGADAREAGIDLHNIEGVPVLRATAKMVGEWGNGLRLEVSHRTPNSGESFTLTVVQEEGGAVVASEVHGNLVMDPASPRFAPAYVTGNSSLIDLEILPGFDPFVDSFPGYSEARRPLGGDLAEVQSTLGSLIDLGKTTGKRCFEVSVNGSAYVRVDLGTWDVGDAGITDLGSLADELRDRVNDALSAFVPAQAVSAGFRAGSDGQQYLRLTATSGDSSTVRVRRSGIQDLASALMLGVDNGGIELARGSNYRPASTGTVFRVADDDGEPAGLSVLEGLTQADIVSVTIGSEPTIALNVDPNSIQTTAAGDPFYRDKLPGDSPNGKNDGVREKLRIIAQAINSAPGSGYRAEVRGYELAILAKAGTFDEIPGQVTFTGPKETDVNARMVRNTRQITLGPNGNSPFIAFDPVEQTGKDGLEPGFAEYVGDPVTKTGFHALDSVDLVNLVILPADLSLTEEDRRQLWGPASIYAQSRRAFLLMDAPDGWTDSEGNPDIVQNTDDVDNLRALVVKDHSAVFYPKLSLNDRGTVRTIGSSGAMAGLMARTDASRGVWKAPAGTEADLRGIVGLQVTLTDRENGVLNKLAVNCARRFSSGFVNWGARTMEGTDDITSEWKYIPIRRLALMIEESLYRGTQWVVFEPNDEPLWAKIRLNVGAFMNGLFRQGAFQGSTPSDAFFVKCDSETTTQADRNLGIVNIEVGFAPLKPAEFVVITIQQIAGDLS